MGRSKQEWARLREEFVRRVAIVGNATVVARELGVNPHTALTWTQRAGLRSIRTGERWSPRRDEYARLRDAGRSRRAAAALVGASARTARDWEAGVRHHGGQRVYPAQRPVPGTMTLMTSPVMSLLEKPIDARYLSLSEREQIADWVRLGVSQREIGRRLGRSGSTISRELGRHRDATGAYGPYAAHRAAVRDRGRPKPAKLAQHGPLRDYVVASLAKGWSPEQISQMLRIEFPDDEDMRASPETIYQAIYVQARGGLKREIAQALRTGRARRAPRRSPQQRTSRFVEPMVMISERPAEVADRAVPGHWEGDLIMGASNCSAIVTLVERATRYVMLGYLPDGTHTAEAVNDVLINLVGTLPAHLRGSLTWDQGAEMAAHHRFRIATGVPVFFCDPASPWQRGSNENTNGLLRQYFPKGTDLQVHGPADLEHVAQLLNGRPRKTLEWKTPAQCLVELI